MGHDVEYNPITMKIVISCTPILLVQSVDTVCECPLYSVDSQYALISWSAQKIQFYSLNQLYCLRIHLFVGTRLFYNKSKDLAL